MINQLAESQYSSSWELYLKSWINRSEAAYMHSCKCSQSSKRWSMSFRSTAISSSMKLRTWIRHGWTSRQNRICLVFTFNSSRLVWWRRSSFKLWVSMESRCPRKRTHLFQACLALPDKIVTSWTTGSLTLLSKVFSSSSTLNVSVFCNPYLDLFRILIHCGMGTPYFQTDRWLLDAT